MTTKKHERIDSIRAFGLAVAVLVAVLARPGQTHGQSKIDPDHRFAWGENIGWTNWYSAGDPEASRGVQIHDTYVEGFVWGENVGWINVGNGPANEVHYANETGEDFGVNIDPDNGNLFGFGWGENIGWINFDTSSLGENRARYNGCRFRGYAWGENVGWINLNDQIHYVGGGSGIWILHGPADWDRTNPNTWMSFEDWAFSAYIDPKIESTNGVDHNLGLTQFDVVFNKEPFGDAVGGPVTPANVSVSVTGGVAPGIANVTTNGNVLTVKLNGLMPLQEWSTFDFQVWNADGIEIADNGNEGEGVDECARLDVGVLPGDVNNDGKTQPLDLSRWIASFSAGGTMLPDAHIRAGDLADYFDLSRDGLVQPLDLSREIAMLSGSPPATQVWNGVSMNNPQP